VLTNRSTALLESRGFVADAGDAV